MQEPTDVLGSPMQEVPPDSPNPQVHPIPPVFPDPPMKPGFQLPPSPSGFPVPPGPHKPLKSPGGTVHLGVLVAPPHPSCPSLPGSQGQQALPGSQGQQALPGLPGFQVPPSVARKCRQERVVYTQEQRQKLEEYFKKCQYPTHEECMSLAESINVKEHQIRTWFKNQRANARKNPHPESALCGEEQRVLPEAPGPAPVDADSMCQDPLGDSFLPQHNPSGIFAVPEAIFSSLGQCRDCGGCSLQDGRAPTAAATVPFPLASATDPGPLVAAAAAAPVWTAASPTGNGPDANAPVTAASGAAPDAAPGPDDMLPAANSQAHWPLQASTLSLDTEFYPDFTQLLSLDP